MFAWLYYKTIECREFYTSITVLVYMLSYDSSYLISIQFIQTPKIM